MKTVALVIGWPLVFALLGIYLVLKSAALLLRVILVPLALRRR
jgi:hypothetical protein